MTDRSAALAVLQPHLPLLNRPPPEIAADLECFFLLLQKWQRVQNLVSRETLDVFWTRHVADSLQILPYLRPDDRTVLDLGSGGGLPAIPLAVACKGIDIGFFLVEPNGRKVSFLRAVARELGLKMTVVGSRAEDIDPSELPAIDVITSRALAPLVQLCALAAPFFGPKTRAILHKGREHVDELAEAGAVWHYDVVVRSSDTDESGVLIELTNLRSATG
jgi:16S rRNA (guanine527-N7)-methyltransferase